MDLPIRERTIEVEVAEGVTAVLETLTSVEIAALMDDNVVTQVKSGQKVNANEVALRVGIDQMVAVFNSNLRELRGLTVGGEPFDPANEDHMWQLNHSFPNIQIAGGTELIQYAMISAAARKNSVAPAEPSPADTASAAG